MSSGEPERGRIDVNVEDLVMTKLSVEEALGKIAIDVRTSLHPALALVSVSHSLVKVQISDILKPINSSIPFFLFIVYGAILVCTVRLQLVLVRGDHHMKRSY